MSNWQLPPEFIQEYLDACKLAATDDEAFKNFRKNDRIATIIENTTKEWADIAMEKMGMTPTMVRYWYTAGLIKDLIGYPNSIIEIGGGYGGMCEIVSSEFELNEYIIYDLPEVIELQKRYLKSRHIDLPEFKTDISEFSYCANLCLSWCAWSELSLSMRKEYAFRVISQCKHFFICSNYNKAEDLEILSKYFTGIKEYDDELVTNVIYI